MLFVLVDIVKTDRLIGAIRWEVLVKVIIRGVKSKNEENTCKTSIVVISSLLINFQANIFQFTLYRFDLCDKSIL